MGLKIGTLNTPVVHYTTVFQYTFRCVSSISKVLHLSAFVVHFVKNNISDFFCSIKIVQKTDGAERLICFKVFFYFMRQASSRWFENFSTTLFSKLSTLNFEREIFSSVFIQVDFSMIIQLFVRLTYFANSAGVFLYDTKKLFIFFCRLHWGSKR